MGWVGHYKQSISSLFCNLSLTTYPRAAIKQAGGVVASVMRASAIMAAMNKDEEAYMLTEFEIGGLSVEEAVEKVDVEGR
jgi:hypothetical protein